MKPKTQNRRRMKLQHCGSPAFCAVLCATLSMPVFSSSALAQESLMRSTIDPDDTESALTRSPLYEKMNELRRKRLQTSAPNTAGTYTTETISDADVEAEALNRLYDDEADGAEGETAESGAGTRPASPSRSESEAGDPSEDTAENSTAKTADKTAKTAGKKTAAASQKPAAKTGGKTTRAPGLDTESTGALVVRQGQNAQMLRAQPAIPAAAIQSRDVREEENPFQATGIRFGAITLRPTFEQGLEVTTNSTGSAGGGSAKSSVSTFGFSGVSDWREGSLETTGSVTLRKALSANSTFEPEAGATIQMTQPAMRDWAYTVGGSYSLKRESAVSGSAFPSTITQRPLAQDVGLSLGIGKNEGALRPSARLEFNRLTYGEATDAAGAQISQSDRDQSTLRGTLRLAAELSPAVTPFVELAYGTTRRDQTVDAFGNDRSSKDLRTSVGAAINLSEKLNGEVSAGWLRQSFGSAGLGEIGGLALAGALNWSPQRGTTFQAGLTTNAEPANSATVSGSLLYAATLKLTHQLSSRVSTSAGFGASLRQFTGNGGEDTTLNAELAATYWVNRTLGVNAKAQYESVSSSDVTRASDTTTFLVGLKLQR